MDENAAELLKTIQENVGNIETYEGMLKKAGAEDRLVIQRQLSTRQVQTISDIHSLIKILMDGEHASSLEAYRDRLEKACRKIASSLEEQIVALRREIDATRELRTSAAVEKRLDLEDRITSLTRRLDVFYQLSLSNLGKMKELGLDLDESVNTFKESLSGRADELSGRLDLDLERIDNLAGRLKQNPDSTEISTLLAAVRKSRENNVISLGKTLDLMESLELPTVNYRAQLVEATSEIAIGLLDISVAQNLVRRGFNSLRAWTAEKGPNVLAKLVLFAVVLLAAYILARLVRKVAVRFIDRSHLHISILLREMILKTAYNLVLLFGFLVALSQVGISLGPLLAGIGVAGFIAGFALQNSLANFAAGLMILIYRPYDIGDLVDLGGVYGKVEKMSLVNTSILTMDNQKNLVPNSRIWGDVIKNVTSQDIRRVDMVFRISYSDDIPKAEKVLNAILKDDKRILDDPEPMIRLHTLGESSVDFIVRPWVKVKDYWDVYWYVTRAVKMRFDEEAIRIPFPQRDVHIRTGQVARNENPSTNI